MAQLLLQTVILPSRCCVSLDCVIDDDDATDDEDMEIEEPQDLRFQLASVIESAHSVLAGAGLSNSSSPAAFVFRRLSLDFTCRQVVLSAYEQATTLMTPGNIHIQTVPAC